jgi:hypothetical protein
LPRLLRACKVTLTVRLQSGARVVRGPALQSRQRLVARSTTTKPETDTHTITVELLVCSCRRRVCARCVRIAEVAWGRRCSRTTHFVMATVGPRASEGSLAEELEEIGVVGAHAHREAVAAHRELQLAGAQTVDPPCGGARARGSDERRSTRGSGRRSAHGQEARLQQTLLRAAQQDSAHLTVSRAAE